jgi:hypothetical protein
MSRRRKLKPPQTTDATTPAAIVEAVDDDLGPGHAVIESVPENALPIDATATEWSVGRVAQDDNGTFVMMQNGECPAAGGTATVASAVEDFFDQPVVDQTPANAPTESEAHDQVPFDPVRFVTVDLPLLRTPAYASNTLRRLEARHAQTLRDLADGLAHEGVKFEGRPILGTDDALAWLLDQLAAGSRM